MNDAQRMLSAWRQYFGGIRWRLTPQGVDIEGSGIARTKGEPTTMRRYWSSWADEFMAACQATGVPIALLLMMVANENGAAQLGPDGSLDVLPVRREPGYVDDVTTPTRISVGPCHLLISTARAVMGDPAINRAWLQDIGHNILACAKYVAGAKAQTGFDPILAAAVYNAGSIREALPGESPYGSRWHIAAYVPPLGQGAPHLDRSAAWYGDACAVVQEASYLSTHGLPEAS